MTVNGVTSNAQATSSTQAAPISGGDMGTFLTLLTTELKVQDPTSPLDPDQMVGQIVSLNQLDELMQINQTLQSMSSAVGSNAASSTAANSTPASSNS